MVLFRAVALEKSEDPASANLTPGQRGLLGTEVLRAEVANGGFEQLFWNGSGDLVPWALDGFASFGCPELHALAVEAAAELGAGAYPTDRALRHDVLTHVSENVRERRRTRWNELNTRFYGSSESLADRQWAYIDAHPDEFFHDEPKG